MRPTIVIGCGDADLCFISRHIVEHAGFAASLQVKPEDIISGCRKEGVCALLIDGRTPASCHICEQIDGFRSQRELRIVALVDPKAHRQALALLNAGADEVLVRPVPPALLLHALTFTGSVQRLVHGDIEMDVSARRVWRADCPIYLPRIEFAILQQFLSQADRVFDRRDIIRYSWPTGIFVDPKTVNVHVGRLRRLLAINGASDPIRCVRGIGYGLKPRDEEESRNRPP
jgi:two-component system phosphate regulon response regulator PhoB